MDDAPFAILVVVGLGAVELWAAIPTGFALGLHPIVTAASAASGAILAVLAVVALGERAQGWLAARHGPSDAGRRRLRDVWRRHGAAGLGLTAPLLVGSPLGTVLGLLLGVPPRSLLIWMAVGASMWSAILTLAVALGLIGLESLG
jgi:hypothetical protein